MADFSFTPAATGIKPVQGMSLGEMMNTARGSQAYQQAEQVNPLTLQQQQQTMELNTMSRFFHSVDNASMNI